MKEYTLVYIRKDNQILMLNRNKKENDLNKDKWIGVGGKLEPNETHLDCMFREVFEETALKVLKYKFLGKINFNFDKYQEIIYLYTVDKYQGEINYNCKEGELKFIDIKKIAKLNLWESDLYFLPYVYQNKKFKQIDIVYNYNVLESVKINHKQVYSIHDKMMELAIKEALKAAKKDEIPIGCVITHNNKVLIKTHNLKQKTKNCLNHAEHLAISKLLKTQKNKYLDECNLYSTLEPCLLCSGAIVQARIKKLFYASKDNKAGFSVSNLNISKHRAIHHKIEVIHLKKYETRVSNLLKDFFKKIRK